MQKTTNPLQESKVPKQMSDCPKCGPGCPCGPNCNCPPENCKCKPGKDAESKHAKNIQKDQLGSQAHSKAEKKKGHSSEEKVKDKENVPEFFIEKDKVEPEKAQKHGEKTQKQQSISQQKASKPHQEGKKPSHEGADMPLPQPGTDSFKKAPLKEGDKQESEQKQQQKSHQMAPPSPVSPESSPMKAQKEYQKHQAHDAKSQHRAAVEVCPRESKPYSTKSGAKEVISGAHSKPTEQKKAKQPDDLGGHPMSQEAQSGESWEKSQHVEEKKPQPDDLSAPKKDTKVDMIDNDPEMKAKKPHAPGSRRSMRSRSNNPNKHLNRLTRPSGGTGCE